MNNLRNLALWILIALLLVLLFNMFQGVGQKQGPQDVKYSDFVQQVDNGAIKQVTIKGNVIKGTLSSGQQFSTNKPEDAEPGPAAARPSRRIQFRAG